MEQFMTQCDKEFMKMAMLKHEETFRQQVHELHRLYRIQKQLMRDMRSDKNNNNNNYNSNNYNNNKELKRMRSSSSPVNHHTRPRRALNLQLPADEYIVNTEQDNETELELTLAIGCGNNNYYYNKKREGTPIHSDSGASFDSSSTESGGPAGHEWGPFQKARPIDLGPDGFKCQSPWIVQCLSLRMT